MSRLGPALEDSAETLARLERLYDRLGSWSKIERIGIDLEADNDQPRRRVSRGWLNNARLEIKRREARGEHTVSVIVADRVRRIEDSLDAEDNAGDARKVCSECGAELSFASRAARATLCSPCRPSLAMRLMVIA